MTDLVATEAGTLFALTGAVFGDVTRLKAAGAKAIIEEAIAGSVARLAAGVAVDIGKGPHCC